LSAQLLCQAAYRHAYNIGAVQTILLRQSIEQASLGFVEGDGSDMLLAVRWELANVLFVFGYPKYILSVPAQPSHKVPSGYL
jgi:hypothetical protein